MGDGPKQVVCHICNQTVTKSKTLAIGDNKRACRIHENIQDLALTEQQKRKEIETVRRDKSDAHMRSIGGMRIDSSKLDLRPKCGSCGCVGLRQDVFWVTVARIIEVMEDEIKGKIDVSNPTVKEVMRHMLQTEEKILPRCLWIVDYEGRMRLRSGAKEMARAFGFAALCHPCLRSNKVNIDALPDDQRFLIVHEEFIFHY